MVWQKQSPRVDLKKKFLRISQNSQENTCACVSFFLWNCSLRHSTLLKKRLRHRCFPVNFEKCFRTPFLYRTPLVVAYGLRLYISISGQCCISIYTFWKHQIKNLLIFLVFMGYIGHWPEMGWILNSLV